MLGLSLKINYSSLKQKHSKPQLFAGTELRKLNVKTGFFTLGQFVIPQCT